MKYKHIVFDIDGTLIDTEYAVLHSLQETIKGLSGRDTTLQGYKDSKLEMTESESVALPFGDSAIYYKKYLIIEARDGIRTRDPRLGKAILHH